MSQAVGRALEKIGGLQPYVLTADLVKQFGLEQRIRDLPDLTFDVGVAEQAMVGIAAGLASLGRPVVCATFAAFLLRGLEVWRNSVLLDDRHVVLIGGHAGLSAGANGATHHALEDAEVFGSFPGVRIFSPCDETELERVLSFAVERPGQYYVRVARDLGTRTLGHGEQQLGEWSRTLSIGPSGGEPDCILVSHGAIWKSVGEAARLAATANPALRIFALHLGDLTHERLPDTLSTSRLIHVAETHADTRMARLARATIQHEEFTALGVTWPSPSDDHNVLLRWAELDVEHIRDVILGGR